MAVPMGRNLDSKDHLAQAASLCSRSPNFLNHTFVKGTGLLLFRIKYFADPDKSFSKRKTEIMTKQFQN